MHAHRRPVRPTHLLAGVLVASAMALATTPVRAAAPADLFISEYVEGTGLNKALEIYNGTGSAVDLAAGGYSIEVFFNGATTAGLSIALAGTVAASDVFVLAQVYSSATVLAEADQTSAAGWYNGDDAVVLRRGATVIDAIGQAGVDPGSEWGSGLTSTADNTLRRDAAVCAGDPDASDAFDPAVQWVGFATDAFDGLGAHTTACAPTPAGLDAEVVRPLDPAGTRTFKHGRTLPVRIVMAEPDGTLRPDLAPTIRITKLAGATPEMDLGAPASSSGADTTGVMRWVDGLYAYNLATRPLPDPSAMYRLTITVPATGQVVTVTFGLRP